MLDGRYRMGRYRTRDLIVRYGARVCQLLQKGAFDLVMIQSEALPWLPAWVERILLAGKPFVVDYDDATFHTYDTHRSSVVRALLGHRIDVMMRSAELVIAGNGYIATRALASGARRVEILPTVVDVVRYKGSAQRFARGLERILLVWCGQPTSVRYLSAVAAAIQHAARRIPLGLRVIGASDVDIPGVHVERCAWSEESEAELIAGAHIGIMPLPDAPWERGKCGYKLIQYMACGLPVLASPVGANTEVVTDGLNGFLCATPEDWSARICLLAADPALRARLGAAGRAVVEQRYSLDSATPKLASWLRASARPTLSQRR